MRSLDDLYNPDMPAITYNQHQQPTTKYAELSVEQIDEVHIREIL
jgi:hypothetical protein